MKTIIKYHISHILVTLLGIYNTVTEVQSLNAIFPIVVTLLGYSNASQWITTIKYTGFLFVIPLGIVILVNEVQLLMHKFLYLLYH